MKLPKDHRSSVDGERVKRKSAILEGCQLEYGMYAFNTGLWDVMQQALKENFVWMTISRALAWTGSGVLQKLIQEQFIGIRIVQ